MVGRVKSLLAAIGAAGALALPARAVDVEAVVGPLTSNTNVTWNWAIESDQQISAGEGGSVTGTGGGWYRLGNTVSNDASADIHYNFSGRSGDVPSGMENDNPLVYTNDRNPRIITADFSLKQYAVTVASEIDGLTDVGDPTGAGSYDAFSSVTSSVPTVVVNPTNSGVRYVVEGFDTN